VAFLIIEKNEVFLIIEDLIISHKFI